MAARKNAVLITAGALAAAAVLLLIAFEAAAPHKKNVGLGTANIYSLRGAELYGRIASALKPDDGTVYCDADGPVQFTPDGTITNMAMNLYASGKVLGIPSAYAYQTAVGGNALVIRKHYRMKYRAFTSSKANFYRLKDCMEAADKIVLKSIVKQYTVGKPDFYQISFKGYGSSTAMSALNPGTVSLLASPGGVSRLGEDQTLRGRDPVFCILPFYKNRTSENEVQLTPPSQGTVSYGGDNAVYVYVDEAAK